MRKDCITFYYIWRHQNSNVCNQIQKIPDYWSQDSTSNTVHPKWLLKFTYLYTKGRENAKSSSVNGHWTEEFKWAFFLHGKLFCLPNSITDVKQITYPWQAGFPRYGCCTRWLEKQKPVLRFKEVQHNTD